MVSTISSPTPLPESTYPSNRVVLQGVSWQTYKALMADIGDNRICRIAYFRGILEIRMPLTEHEEPVQLLGDFVKGIADELEIELRCLGALLLERDDLSRAIEPDSCFYIQNEAKIRGKNIQLPEDPPPDLVIESDYTSSSLNKFEIYSSLGVLELWRYYKQRLEIYLLDNGEYKISEVSLAFPFLPVAEISGFIDRSKTEGQRASVRLFRSRIKEILNELK